MLGGQTYQSTPWKPQHQLVLRLPEAYPQCVLGAEVVPRLGLHHAQVLGARGGVDDDHAPRPQEQLPLDLGCAGAGRTGGKWQPE